MFECIIEIPLGSRMKYEVNESNELFLDRVLPRGCVFPGNYGFIPNTLAGDGDPLDVLIITDYPIQSLCRVRCRTVGVLLMSDEKGLDEKVLAVPIADDTYKNVEDITDVSERTLQEIKMFFKTYKLLENKKWTHVEGYENSDFARKMIQKYRL